MRSAANIQERRGFRSLSAAFRARLCFFVVAFACLGLRLHGAEPETADGADILTLIDGKKIVGKVLNPDLGFRTAYGEVRLKTRHLASLRIDQGEYKSARVTTLNSNLFTGFLQDAGFQIELPNHQQAKIRWEQVVRLEFGIRVPEEHSRKADQTLWVELRNGDRLSGQLVTDPLRMREDGTNSAIDARQLVSLTFATNQPSLVTAQCGDQALRTGMLEAEDLEFRLEAGPTLKLYVGMIAWIGTARDVRFEASTATHTAKDTSGNAAPAGHYEGFVWVPPGEFLMGSPTEETGREPDEGPQTRVVFPRGFWISEHEVTQREYQRVMGANPSNATGDADRPVERVTWFEAIEYCNKRTDQAERAGTLPADYVYRLPTEAEWERACRAGTDTRFSFGEDREGMQLVNYAWFTRNSESVTHPVGTRQPNPWGLYDMQGNVWEWCLDRWEDGLPGGVITNRPVRASGSLRVARGGSWLYEPKACRCANRDDYSPWNRCSDIGFRVVLAPVQ